jgi:hypothetical protein
VIETKPKEDEQEGLSLHSCGLSEEEAQTVHGLNAGLSGTVGQTVCLLHKKSDNRFWTHRPQRRTVRSYRLELSAGHSQKNTPNE